MAIDYLRQLATAIWDIANPRDWMRRGSDLVVKDGLNVVVIPNEAGSDKEESAVPGQRYKCCRRTADPSRAKRARNDNLNKKVNPVRGISWQMLYLSFQPPASSSLPSLQDFALEQP